MVLYEALNKLLARKLEFPSHITPALERPCITV